MQVEENPALGDDEYFWCGFCKEVTKHHFYDEGWKCGTCMDGEVVEQNPPTCTYCGKPIDLTQRSDGGVVYKKYTEGADGRLYHVGCDKMASYDYRFYPGGVEENPQGYCVCGHHKHQHTKNGCRICDCKITISEINPVPVTEAEEERYEDEWWWEDPEQNPLTKGFWKEMEQWGPMAMAERAKPGKTCSCGKKAVIFDRIEQAYYCVECAQELDPQTYGPEQNPTKPIKVCPICDVEYTYLSFGGRCPHCGEIVCYEQNPRTACTCGCGCDIKTSEGICPACQRGIHIWGVDAEQNPELPSRHKMAASDACRNGKHDVCQKYYNWWYCGCSCHPEDLRTAKLNKEREQVIKRGHCIVCWEKSGRSVPTEKRGKARICLDCKSVTFPESYAEQNPRRTSRLPPTEFFCEKCKKYNDKPTKHDAILRLYVCDKCRISKLVTEHNPRPKKTEYPYKFHKFDYVTYDGKIYLVEAVEFDWNLNQEAYTLKDPNTGTIISGVDGRLIKKV